MKTKLLHLLSMMLLCLISLGAHAAITCTSPVSTGFSTAYNPTQATANVTQGTVNTTCTRGLATDPTSVIVAANTGLNPTGAINRASFGANRIQYSGYKNSSCTGVLWTNWSVAGTITVTLLPVTTAQPISINFWGCIIVAGQNVPAGTYTDSVTIGIFDAAAPNAILSPQPTFPVTITNPASCTITSIGNVVFGTYTALQAVPLVAPSANVVLNCTTNMPYTLALDTTSGVMVGLNYTLALSTNSSRGTGPGQTHTITGTMPAGQAGACSTGTCAGTNTHTLTITY